RSYFFLLQWQWYEWLGALAPLLILWLLGRFFKSRSLGAASLISRSLVEYGFVYLVAGLVLTIPVQFQPEARLQPMRSLHLLYILMFLLAGGLLGQFIFQRHVWRWIALFAPLSASMFFVQRQLFPASPHIEWPNAEPQNDWLRAFEWIRRNTPAEAV